jgi:hypothetical protein
MSTTARPSIPLLFLGGYFLFFIGMVLSLVGGVELGGGPGPTPVPKPPLVPALLLGVGLVGSVLGTWLMVRAEPVELQQLGMVAVLFILTPLPAIVGLGINYLGPRLRHKPSPALQIILMAVGAFLLFLAVDWGGDAVQNLRAARRDRESWMWPVVGNLGLVALVLGVLPTFTGTHEAEAAKECELPEGPSDAK